MRKIVLFLAVLFMTVPAMAASNVTITCAQTPDTNEVVVSYASDGNLIRAFGLDVNVVGANITKVVPVDADYRIYPGQIVIVDGNVTDYNTPYAPGDLGDANVAVEMGSLYTTDPCYAGDPNAGYGMQPGLSGTLLKFYVDGSCTYAVAENPVSGGVVMEDPTEVPNVTLCSGSVTIGPTECMAGTNPDYTKWEAANKPDCWCYPRQCHGDVDDNQEYGAYWVLLLDLAEFRTYFSATGITGPPGICCDFAHDVEYGAYRVLLNDLAIFRTYFSSTSVPCCDQDGDCDETNDNYFNFWCSPPGCP